MSGGSVFDGVGGVGGVGGMGGVNSILVVVDLVNNWYVDFDY